MRNTVQLESSKEETKKKNNRKRPPGDRWRKDRGGGRKNVRKEITKTEKIGRRKRKNRRGRKRLETIKEENVLNKRGKKTEIKRKNRGGRK